MKNVLYEWVDFSKFSQTWAKIDLDLRKFWKNRVILLKISPQIGQIGTWMGHFLLKTLVYIWVYFQCPWQHIPTKTKLENPPGSWDDLFFIFEIPKLQTPG